MLPRPRTTLTARNAKTTLRIGVIIGSLIPAMVMGADNEAPSVPGNLTGSAANSSRIELTWDASVDYGGGIVAGYDVYRDGVKWASNVTQTAYADTRVEGGKSYSYRVDAFDNATPRNKSAKSNTVLVNAPTGGDNMPPSAPSNLTAAEEYPSEITLRWSPSQDFGGGSVVGYDVYRDGKKIAHTVTDTTYFDATVDPNTTYSYRVDAFDDAEPRNKSKKSNTATITTESDVTDSGNEECVGVTIFTSDDAAAVIANSPAGTTFCFAPGTHYLTSPIVPQTGDQYIGEPGAILDGANTITHAVYGYGGEKGQTDVTIRGLIIQNFQGVYEDFKKRNAIKVGNDWLVEDNEIRYNSETGIHIGVGLVLRNNKIHHNGRYGITGGPGLDQNILIEGNEIAYNNARDLPWATAGTAKVVGSSQGATGLRWIDNWVHHNNGHGIHHDGNTGPGIEIAGNLIEHNIGSGIQHEASWGIEIHDNHFYNNAKKFLKKSCFHGAQILNNNSSDMRIYNNHIESDEEANGVCMVDTDSRDYFPNSETVTNTTVTNNTIKLIGIGQNGLVGNGEFAPYDEEDVFFNANTYYLPDPSPTARHWAFIQYPLDKSQWNALGQDPSSQFLQW